MILVDVGPVLLSGLLYDCYSTCTHSITAYFHQIPDYKGYLTMNCEPPNYKPNILLHRSSSLVVKSYERLANTHGHPTLSLLACPDREIA